MKPGGWYRLRGPEVPKYLVLENEVAAFNPATWDTHLLGRSAAVVLNALADGPLPLAALEEALGADPSRRELATAVVAELEAAELIVAERIDPPR